MRIETKQKLLISDKKNMIKINEVGKRNNLIHARKS